MSWNLEDFGKPESERKPIILLFMSPGGDLNVNNSLVDTIMLSKTPVIGVNCGMAASAACFIFLACHKRYTFPTAEFLVHKGSGSFGGTYEEVISAILNYQRQIEHLGEFVLSRTNIEEEEFWENFSTDWYLDAEEAVERGLCSKIIKSLDEIWDKE
jgi:ATP-dependent Clp protease protease subunit